MSTVKSSALRDRLHGLDGRDYAAYQALRGRYSLHGLTLTIERVPKDPYAPPGTGSFRVTVPRPRVGISDELLSTEARCVAVRDALARSVEFACRPYARPRGTGSSGVIAIAPPGQAILPRTSVMLDGAEIEIRLFVGLPSHGRKIDATRAIALLLEELPTIIGSALCDGDAVAKRARGQVEAVEDAAALRAALEHHDLVALVADGAVLPRRSGVDSRPLEDAVPFGVPDALRTTIEAPHAGAVSGLGVPRGVTLIVGGGFHGKTTLLRAIEEGIYDHVPGDGRDRCVTQPGAVKIRAGEGRRIAGVDVSQFVADAPGVGDTTRLSTDNASGSTSQAASIIEALEIGADVLLFDEDTCAANLMVRDRRMQELVADEDEPIRPLIDYVADLRESGISVVLVAGSSGEWLDVADTVIQMRRFTAIDMTGPARALASERPTGRHREDRSWSPPARRRPDATAIDATGPHGHSRIAAPRANRLLLGTAEIDLSDIDQLLEAAQTKAIGLALLRLRLLLEAGHTLTEAVAQVHDETEAHGLDLLEPTRTGDLAAFRRFELAAAFNRLRIPKHTDSDV